LPSITPQANSTSIPPKIPIPQLPSIVPQSTPTPVPPKIQIPPSPIQQLPSITPQANPTSVPLKIQIPQLPNITPQSTPTVLNNGFAKGGLVKGPGGPTDDKIPAKLSAGEYVIPAEVVKNNQDLIASIDEATTS